MAMEKLAILNLGISFKFRLCIKSIKEALVANIKIKRHLRDHNQITGRKTNF